MLGKCAFLSHLRATLDHMDPEAIAALEELHAEYCAMMQPFWDEQQREADELAELLAYESPDLRALREALAYETPADRAYREILAEPPVIKPGWLE